MTTEAIAAEDAGRNQNGNAIRAIRQLVGLSADDLAQILLVATPTIWAYENEHRNCPPEKLAQIAKALGVDVRALARKASFGVTGAAA